MLTTVKILFLWTLANSHCFHFDLQIILASTKLLCLVTRPNESLFGGVLAGHTQRVWLTRRVAITSQLLCSVTVYRSYDITDFPMYCKTYLTLTPMRTTNSKKRTNFDLFQSRFQIAASRAHL